MAEVTSVVDAILTAILQWKVLWLEEQKKFPKPPPISKKEPRMLKVTYDSYKDYESTFIPLLMHEIWAQIYEEWSKIETEINGGSPMEVDGMTPASSNSGRVRIPGQVANVCPKQFWIGVADYKSEGLYHCRIRCQYIIDTNKLATHLKAVGEGDLVCLDLVADSLAMGQVQTAEHYGDIQSRMKPKSDLLKLFGYVVDVQTERIQQYTTLSECFVARSNYRSHHVINYHVIIAKRPLRLKLSQPMKMTGLYYLKPMIRQIESIALLKESALASDILSPKVITCQLSIPTIVTLESPHYNDAQYKTIIGANEALVRNIPKIQLIQGPPGTGKTHTLIGIIKHFFLKWSNPTIKSPKILICAPSNGAIDEVARRLYKEREFLKSSEYKRSLRMVRVGNPDHISESIRCISLEELVETNASHKVEAAKKKHTAQIKELEDELSRCDTEITNLRYMQRESEIPKVESKITRLIKQLDATKASEDTTTKRESSEAAKRNMRFELIKNADVILSTLNSCQRYPLDVMFKGERAEHSFQCVVVDEASQCCEPELLMPLCYRISKMILIGDPMQLPATVISRYAQDFNYGQSLFERFFIHFGKYSPTSPIAMLTNQYRMHPDICSFPSKQFYDNRLVSAKRTTKKHTLAPYLMFDLRHSSESKNNRTSLENEVEADFTRNLLLAILGTAPENSKIGVITPYKAQKRLITNRIDNLTKQRNMTIDVNTCDGFQGQEKDIIILSCVRASESGGGSIGFLKSYQRINVALTRAKYCLIILISAKSLSKDPTWKAMIDDASARKCVHFFTKTPSSESLKSTIVRKDPQVVAEVTIDDNEQEEEMPSPDSQLIKASPGTETPYNGFEPEYVMPMDID